MKWIVTLILVAFAYKHGEPTWYGIPDSRSCGLFGRDRLATCIAGDAQYTCIADDVDGCNTPNGDAIQCTKSMDSRVQREHHRQQEQDDDQQQQQNTMVWSQ